MHKQYQNGFTIVELLIVIVVIAILASVSVVAYTGVQNRAHDTAVQSDLRGLTNKVMIAQIEDENSIRPDAQASDFQAHMNNFLPVTKSSYDNQEFAFVYGFSASGWQPVLVGTSKSGKIYMHEGGNLREIESYDDMPNLFFLYVWSPLDDQWMYVSSS